MADLFWAEFLEEAGEEITCVVDQNVDSAKRRDGGLNGRIRILRTCHIELDGQHVVVVAHRGRDLRSIAASGDDGIACGQGRLGDIDPEASTSSGDEPYPLFTHGTSPHSGPRSHAMREDVVTLFVIFVSTSPWSRHARPTSFRAKP